MKNSNKIKVNKFLLLLLTIMSYYAQAQKIWVGDLSIDNFEVFSSEKYDEVKGTIYIENYKGNDLSVLESLKKCMGNIIITDNEKLESLKGLENLQIVDGMFSITENTELYDYCALQKRLVTQGIKGVKLSKGIIERWETEDNGYNPSLMNLQNRSCKSYNLRDFNLSF